MNSTAKKLTVADLVSYPIFNGLVIALVLFGGHLLGYVSDWAYEKNWWVLGAPIRVIEFAINVMSVFVILGVFFQWLKLIKLYLSKREVSIQRKAMIGGNQRSSTHYVNLARKANSQPPIQEESSEKMPLTELMKEISKTEYSRIKEGIQILCKDDDELRSVGEYTLAETYLFSLLQVWAVTSLDYDNRSTGDKICKYLNTLLIDAACEDFDFPQVLSFQKVASICQIYMLQLLNNCEEKNDQPVLALPEEIVWRVDVDIVKGMEVFTYVENSIIANVNLVSALLEKENEIDVNWSY